MNRLFSYLSVVASALLLFACNPTPGFDSVPTLEFIALSKPSMIQGDLNTDSIIVTLAFTDGNGDIGSEANSFNTNLVVIDNRTGEDYDRIKLPLIPQEGANNGVKGTINIKLYNACCLFDDRPNCTSSPNLTNQMTLDIHLTDNAGNQSNTVTTSPIALICK